jgi:diadenylate cyclase
MSDYLNNDVLSVLSKFAPGNAVRAGLDRILNGHSGALLVIGVNESVKNMLSGGFIIDSDFSPAKLRELCKMDGAVILDSNVERILYANVHLLPDSSYDTDETGTRHRTADRVAQQSGLPVVSISASLSTIALYYGGRKYIIEDSLAISSRVVQALQTLERYRVRFSERVVALSSLEVEDEVTVKDVCSVIQHSQMIVKISREIEDSLIELGLDGRLLALQWHEIVGDFNSVRQYLLYDYIAEGKDIRQVNKTLSNFDFNQLLTLESIAEAMGLGNSLEVLLQNVSARGYRALYDIFKSEDEVIDPMVAHFKTLQNIISASGDDLLSVQFITKHKARIIREGLARLLELTAISRYV